MYCSIELIQGHGAAVPSTRPQSSMQQRSIAGKEKRSRQGNLVYRPLVYSRAAHTPSSLAAPSNRRSHRHASSPPKLPRVPTSQGVCTEERRTIGDNTGPHSLAHTYSGRVQSVSGSFYPQETRHGSCQRGSVIDRSVGSVVSGQTRIRDTGTLVAMDNPPQLGPSVEAAVPRVTGSSRADVEALAITARLPGACSASPHKHLGPSAGESEVFGPGNPDYTVPGGASYWRKESGHGGSARKRTRSKSGSLRIGSTSKKPR